MLALAQPGEAKIIYTPAHAKVGTTLPVDLNHDGIVDFYLNIFDHDGVNPLSACQFWARFISSTACISSGTNKIRTIDSKGQRFGAALRYGAKIQRGEQFAKGSAVLGSRHGGTVSTSSAAWFGPWLNGGKGVKNRYLGVKFIINGKFHYGWLRMTVATPDRYFTATLTGYAYETIPNKGIIAGRTKGPDVFTVPPGSLGRLALGRK